MTATSRAISSMINVCVCVCVCVCVAVYVWHVCVHVHVCTYVRVYAGVMEVGGFKEWDKTFITTL